MPSNQIMDGDQFDFLFKVVLIGDSGVGKSNILSRFVSNKFRVDTSTTIGVEFTTKNLQVEVNGAMNKVKLQLWDTAGQERYRSITAAYYRGAVGCLLVYDVTRPGTFEKCDQWLQELKQNANGDVQVVLVGNKIDLQHLREVQTEEGTNFADKNGLSFIETSASSGKNVEDAFVQLVKNVIQEKAKNMQTDTNTGPNFVPVHVDDDKKSKKGCC